MLCDFSPNELLHLLRKQIYNFWNYQLPDSIEDVIIHVLKRMEMNFSNIEVKGYQKEGVPYFDIIHTNQYAIFLYTLSNECFKNGDKKTASYIYYLNKIMNGLEIYYEVELPSIFCFEHPLSTVLGRAKYNDYLFVMGGVTVGQNRRNGILQRPVLGHHVSLYTNATIIGNVTIGNYVAISANSYIRDMIIPDNCIVYGTYPNVQIKYKTQKEMENISRELWVN